MHLLYFALAFLLFTFQAKAEDWSHSGGHNDLDGEEDYTEDGEGSGAQGDKKSFQIGIALPWVSTARHSVASIPKAILVPVYNETQNFVCKVALAGNPKVKILGQLHYPTMKCSIPVTKAGVSSHYEQLKTFPTVPSPWGHFEVLTNPQLLNLKYVITGLRQNPAAFRDDDRTMPARPVLAEPKNVSKKSGYSPPFIASVTHKYRTFVGVAQEVSQNGTLAFYYGLVNIQGIYFINVLTVLNTRPPLIK